MCMIEDVKKLFRQDSLPKTVVVVAPRILLANQLSSEFLEQNLDGNYNQGVEVIRMFIVERHIIRVQLRQTNLSIGITTAQTIS